MISCIALRGEIDRHGGGLPAISRKKKHPEKFGMPVKFCYRFRVTLLAAFPFSLLLSLAVERVSAVDAEAAPRAWLRPAEACAVADARSAEAWPADCDSARDGSPRQDDSAVPRVVGWRAPVVAGDSPAVDWPQAAPVQDDSAASADDSSLDSFPDDCLASALVDSVASLQDDLTLREARGDSAASADDSSLGSLPDDCSAGAPLGDSAASLQDDSPRLEQQGDLVEKRRAQRAVPVAQHWRVDCPDAQPLRSPVFPEAPA
jgi:hypothetical protein